MLRPVRLRSPVHTATWKNAAGEIPSGASSRRRYGRNQNDRISRQGRFPVGDDECYRLFSTVIGKVKQVKRKLRGVKRMIARLIPLLILTAQFAFPCSLASIKLRQVGPNIIVKVTHRSKAIAGIEVEVLPEGVGTDAVFTALTDENGTVHIQGLARGKYYLTASHRGFEAGREWIEVVSDANAVQHFTFQWADDAYQARRIDGMLTGRIPGDSGNQIMDLARPKETVYPGVAITLKNAFADDEYHTLSDSTGSFVIGPVPNGIYVLVIAGGMTSIYGTAEETSHVIDLMQTASRGHLPLLLSSDGCSGSEFKLIEK